MAQPPTVYHDTQEDAAAQGNLFGGLRIFVAVRVPMRSTYVQTVQSNGGTVVRLEKDADVIIADHLRAEAPPNSFSYTWIEACMRAGALVDKETHRAGPSAATARPVGALKPAKQGRAKYSHEDDVELYHWVKNQERRGQKVLGNEIYKQLEEKNPKHPWQSWRDRYVKFISIRPASSFVQADPPTPPLAEIPVQPSPTASTLKEPVDTAQKQPLSTTSPEQPQQLRTDAIYSHNEGGHANVNPSKGSRFYVIPSTTDDSLFVADRAKSASASPSRQNRATLQGQNPARSKPGREFLLNTNMLVYDTDYHEIYGLVPRIQNIPVENYGHIWEDLANRKSYKSASEWRDWYETVLLPKWREKEGHKASDPRPVLGTSSVSEQFNDALEHPEAASHGSSLLSKSTQSEGDAAQSGGTKPTQQQLTSTYDGPSSLFTNPVVVIESPTKALPAMSNASSSHGFEEANVSKGAKRKAMPQVGNTSRKRQHTDHAPSQTIPQPSRLSSSTVRDPLQHSQIADSIHLVDIEDDGHTEAFNGRNPFMQTTYRPDFEVYESHGIPEGEKENFNGSESPMLQMRHNHVKSEEALEVFTDPPSGGFMLQAPETLVDIDEQTDYPADSWHDIDNLQGEDASAFVAHMAAGDAGAATPGDILDELRSEYESRHQSDELESEASLDWRSAANDPDTQAILNAETQAPDFDMPMPRDESQDEDNPPAPGGAEKRQMGQQDEDGPSIRDGVDLADRVDEELDGEEDFDVYEAYIADDLDMGLPPPETDQFPEEDEQSEVRILDGVKSSGQPHPRSNQRRSSHRSNRDKIRLYSSSPHHSERGAHSIASALNNRPTISNITVGKESQLGPYASALVSASASGLTSSPLAPERKSTPRFSSDPRTPIRSKPRASSTTAAPNKPQEPLSATQIHTLLTTFIAMQTARGHKPPRILYALQRTNLDGALAEHVLQCLDRDGVVPADVPGVWTEEDDRVMQGGDAGALKRLEEKHGREGYGVRMEMAGVWGII